MKVRIVSLFLSVAFLSILTFEYISNTILLENSTTQTVEYVLEKITADKFLDDNYLISSNSHNVDIQTRVPHTFEKVFYSFKPTNTLFRPPITI